MPQYLLDRRYWQRVHERLARRGPGVLDSWAAQGGGFFIDYFTNIPATIPEKVLFAELMRRHINFKFSWYIGNIKSTYWQYEHYRPDFILMDYNIIIEVFGGYWHSRAGSAEYDSVRNGLLTTLGYRVFSMLDSDIMYNVRAALDRAIPELINPRIMGDTVMVGDRPINPSAPLAARQKKYPKKVVARYKTAIRKLLKFPVYKLTPKPRKAETDYSDLLIGEFGDDEYWSAYIKYENLRYGTEQGWYDIPKGRGYE